MGYHDLLQNRDSALQNIWLTNQARKSNHECLSRYVIRLPSTNVALARQLAFTHFRRSSRARKARQNSVDKENCNKAKMWINTFRRTIMKLLKNVFCIIFKFFKVF